MQTKPSPYDFEALLAFHKATFGDATMMSTPAGDPAAATSAPSPTSTTISDTAGGGVIVGADPRPTPQNTFTQVNPGQHANPATVAGPVFTAEQIAKARQEEKDKLYPELQSMKEQLAELKKERDAKLEAERQAREEAERKAEEARKADTDTRTLLEQQKAEFDAKLAEMEQQRAQERQVLEMERQFQALQTYKAQAIAAAADDIIPELANELQATNHSSTEEIDAHIARLKATSSSILESMQAAVQAQRAGMRGAPVTAPPAGPLDTYSGHDSAWEAASNGSLTFEDYVKNRDKLLSGVSRNVGLYG